MKKTPAKKTAAKSAKKTTRGFKKPVGKPAKKAVQKFMVTCSYSGYSFEVDEKIRKAAGYSDASGCGFGDRDHAWYNLTEAKAKAKAAKLKSAKVKGLKVHVEKDGSSSP